MSCRGNCDKVTKSYLRPIATKYIFFLALPMMKTFPLAFFNGPSTPQQSPASFSCVEVRQCVKTAFLCSPFVLNLILHQRGGGGQSLQCFTFVFCSTMAFPCLSVYSIILFVTSKSRFKGFPWHCEFVLCI